MLRFISITRVDGVYTEQINRLWHKAFLETYIPTNILALVRDRIGICSNADPIIYKDQMLTDLNDFIYLKTAIMRHGATRIVNIKIP